MKNLKNILNHIIIYFILSYIKDFLTSSEYSVADKVRSQNIYRWHLSNTPTNLWFSNTRIREAMLSQCPEIIIIGSEYILLEHRNRKLLLQLQNVGICYKKRLPKGSQLFL